MALPDRIRFYLTHSIAGTPTVLYALLGYFPSNSGFWDYRPEADRFTPREVLAHLADWDPIFEERLERMLAEDGPVLPDIDEGELALERRYGLQDPAAGLIRLRESRVSLEQAVSGVKEGEWDRTGHRESIGDITVSNLVTMIVGHDAYHVRQLSEYLQSWRKI